MYTVEINNKQGNVFEVKAKENSFIIEPLTDRLSPGEVLLASLGSCMGFFARRYLESSKISSAGFSLKLTADFTKDQPMRFKEITVSFDLGQAGLDPSRKEAFIRFIENCPIHNTLKGNPGIKVELR